ncbi:hypothetical protein ACTL32_08720 [Planococcus sp. FY231025]|uniref:hypothetical protein n=1 Tax=Planococcus sp. FY231025 TaxID=3455699 RepID=UPI003F935301
MNYSELLQHQGYIYLNTLFEPKDNSLIVDIDHCKPFGKAVAGTNPSSSYGVIEVDETLPILRLEFDWYIAYSVRDESFTVIEKYEVYEGSVFSLYSKSRYLDFINVSTIADEVHPGPFKHYGINALNHIIDVISMDPPKISYIHRDSQRD